MSRLIIDIATACYTSRCLYSAIHLRFADIIGNSGISVAQLSEAASCDVRLATVILRVLHDHGVFSIDGETIKNNENSHFLRRDHPNSLAAVVDWVGSDEVWASLWAFPNAARDGISGFQKAHGMDFFGYLAKKPEISRIFSESMAQFTKRDVASVLSALNFGSYRRIVDVGSGHGVLAVGLANRYPLHEVIAFDLPGVLIGPFENTKNLSVMRGDFFKDRLPEADLYVLMNVIHDWPDDEACAIIKSISEVAPADCSICIIEGILDSDEKKVNMVGLGMAVLTGGQQRSFNGIEKILHLHGFILENHVRCNEYLSAILARRGQNRS